MDDLARIEVEIIKVQKEWKEEQGAKRIEKLIGKTRCLGSIEHGCKIPNMTTKDLTGNKVENVDVGGNEQNPEPANLDGVAAGNNESG